MNRAAAGISPGAAPSGINAHPLKKKFIIHIQSVDSIGSAVPHVDKATSRPKRYGIGPGQGGDTH